MYAFTFDQIKRGSILRLPSLCQSIANPEATEYLTNKGAYTHPVVVLDTHRNHRDESKSRVTFCTVNPTFHFPHPITNTDMRSAYITYEALYGNSTDMP